jgi:putative DNA methylase
LLMTYKPKLIEVALPLAAINKEASREKAIRHGHPSTLHLWWARRPLAAARAVIWASLVDDPSGDESLSVEQQEVERQRLFRILEELVKWENSNNPVVLAAAKAEIDRCFPEGAPPILDPFGGGGAIPLEAQRLGLKALSGDLNPVAVLIQKAMIEIPPRFAGKRPVHPDIDVELTTWERAQGLAADVEAYGQWMRDEAERRIGHLYPKATGSDGEKLTPIAWIWARTVESPDPSWNGHVPLVASWTLAKKPGKPKVWIEPIIDRKTQTISYEIRTGGEPSYERTISRGNGTCIATGAAIPGDYIKARGRSGLMGQQLIAVVAEGKKPGRTYCGPLEAELAAAACDLPDELPAGKMSSHPQYMGTYRYGLDEWWKLFTPRQLTALTTFSDLLPKVRERVIADAAANGVIDDGVRLRDGGSGATAYADAIVTYLAFVIDKCTDYWSAVCSWNNTGEKIRNIFGRQAIPMTWDFAETNPFSSSTGNWMAMVNWVRKSVNHLPVSKSGEVVQRDARARVRESPGAVVSTDPPYYDSVPYSDISDFFFVWLRRNLADVWPDECATLLTPKANELVADNQRFGSREGAKEHFESGMAEFMAEVAAGHHPDVPSTIYYAYKASESGGEDGWSTFLQGVMDAGLQVNATWPMRTELANRMRSLGSNALASSIILACRPREGSAVLATRGEFVAALRDELPAAVQVLQSGNIAPVDMAQSAIGPGIKVFSRFAKVVEADGSAMPVSAALAIINNILGEILDGEEADLDADTRFAVTWYSQYGYNPASSGDADTLAKAKVTSLSGIADAGIGEARAGAFRLFERSELDTDWTPVGDDRLTVWEATQYLILALERSESEAAELLRQLGGFADRARQLAYLLFQKATDKGWADEAASYNGLITAWPTLQTAPAPIEETQDEQQELL